jgi:F0F1-type ATP synthase epsilon subunit
MQQIVIHIRFDPNSSLKFSADSVKITTDILGEIMLLPNHYNAIYDLTQGDIEIILGASCQKFSIQTGIAKFENNHLEIFCEKIL